MSRGEYFVLVYIIEENRRLFNLAKKMLKNSRKYIFLYEDAEFSADMQEYMACNEVLVFKAVFPKKIDAEMKVGSVDLAVFGEVESDINADLSKVKTSLLNIENIDRLKNIDFGSSQVITCGLREKDTVIFSSIDLDEGNVMLDLQRSIVNIKGENIEPFEKKILLEGCTEGYDAEDILFALTVLLYCGRVRS